MKPLSRDKFSSLSSPSTRESKTIKKVAPLITVSLKIFVGLDSTKVALYDSQFKQSI